MILATVFRDKDQIAFLYLLYYDDNDVLPHH